MAWTWASRQMALRAASCSESGGRVAFRFLTGSPDRSSGELRWIPNRYAWFCRVDWLELTWTWQVYWSESGELVALACEDTCYVLRFSRENFTSAVQSGDVEEDGVESAFEVITDINER